MENSILYSEINIVCMLMLSLIALKVNRSAFLQEQRQLLLRVIISNVLFLALDGVWVFANNSVFTMSYSINWALNEAYYMLSGVVGYLWFQYSETVQDSKLVREKKYRRIALIPILLLIFLSLISLKTGWLFYIDANNVYHRGPAYVLQLLTSYGYVVFTAMKALGQSRRTEDYRKKMEWKTLFTFVLPTIFAGLLQVAFPGFPILCIGNTVGIMYVYLSLQEQMVSLDALTKLNNRNALYQYLSGKLTHPHENKELYLLMMDVDYFKSINDKFGHVEGDRALQTVANVLMKVCRNRSYFIARFGGDEFVVICELDPKDGVTPEDVCELIWDTLKEEKRPYALELSIGYARYTPDIRNQQEFIDLADKELYKVKQARHSRR